ncbi:cytochrome c oxidase subunit 2 [Palleronia aestuarii]|uniref:Cytochrome c oxidase subunit 2 n=1 Tax=Palleronia aestuarii TaxID=568105 RepID=A0A2W7P8H3_9RHOB|nr:cytochrome c oxidase subunit 2 [Palleronia aestuarii]
MRHPFLLTAAAILSAGAVQAQDALDGLPIIGKPEHGGIGFQPAVTGIADDVHWLDGMVLVIITVITLFVVALLAYVAVRFNSKRGHEPKSFTHNTPVEIAWTLIPIVILVFIGAFSLPILFNQQEIPEGEVTIKATGYQWYWGYEYVDHDFAFDSYMIGSPATGGDNRLNDEVRMQLQEAGYTEDEFKLATDTAMVVPVDTVVVLQVTGADVIHSWTIPAFGVKQDAVPGRLAELWFEADEEGVYFGQCSELCGIAHAFMPITVKVVSQDAYEAWLDGAIEEYGGTPRDASMAQQADGSEGAVAASTEETAVETEDTPIEMESEAASTNEGPENSAQEEYLTGDENAPAPESEGDGDAAMQDDASEDSAGAQGESDASERAPAAVLVDEGAEDAAQQ